MRQTYVAIPPLVTEVEVDDWICVVVEGLLKVVITVLCVGDIDDVVEMVLVDVEPIVVRETLIEVVVVVVVVLEVSKDVVLDIEV